MIEVSEKILDDIATDRRSGATSLAGLGLDALDALGRHLSAVDGSAREQLLQMVRHLDTIRPSMGAIGVQAVLVFTRASHLVEQGLPWNKAIIQAVAKERETLGQADRSISFLAAQEIGEGGIVVSCSWSATVQRVLVALQPSLVRIGEGHGLGDGVRAARWLAARGIDVEVWPDGALPTAVEKANAVVIGADQVLADGTVVNRSSSFSLALAASYFGIPFFVVCQRIKLSGKESVEIEEMRKILRGVPREIKTRTPVFDVTPGGLVYRILTEAGALTPRDAGEVGQGIAKLRDTVLGED